MSAIVDMFDLVETAPVCVLQRLYVMKPITVAMTRAATTMAQHHAPDYAPPRYFLFWITAERISHLESPGAPSRIRNLSQLSPKKSNRHCRVVHACLGRPYLLSVICALPPEQVSSLPPALVGDYSGVYSMGAALPPLEYLDGLSNFFLSRAQRKFTYLNHHAFALPLHYLLIPETHAQTLVILILFFEYNFLTFFTVRKLCST